MPKKLYNLEEILGKEQYKVLSEAIRAATILSREAINAQGIFEAGIEYLHCLNICYFYAKSIDDMKIKRFLLEEEILPLLCNTEHDFYRFLTTGGRNKALEPEALLRRWRALVMYASLEAMLGNQDRYNTLVGRFESHNTLSIEILGIDTAMKLLDQVLASYLSAPDVVLLPLYELALGNLNSLISQSNESNEDLKQKHVEFLDKANDIYLRIEANDSKVRRCCRRVFRCG